MLFDTLNFIDSVCTNLNSGVSVSRAIEMSASEQTSRISKFSLHFLASIRKGEAADAITVNLKRSENKILFLILELGIKGYPILQTLEEFYKELKISNATEIEAYQRTLPFKMMIPLMFCYFPAVFILFLGPFILEFFEFSNP